MNNTNVIPMRPDALDATDLTRMLDRNHARGKLRRRRKRMVIRNKIIRLLTTVFVIGAMAALGAW